MDSMEHIQSDNELDSDFEEDEDKVENEEDDEEDKGQISASCCFCCTLRPSPLIFMFLIARPTQFFEVLQKKKIINEDDVVQFSYNEYHYRLEVSDVVLAEPLHVPLFGAYTLAIYSKYFIVQRGIKSIFSVPAYCQNLNILSRRKTTIENHF